MKNRLIHILIMLFVLVCCVACGKTNGEDNTIGANWKHPQECVGVYDGETGGIMQLNEGGTGKYIEQGWKEWDSLEWDVNIKSNVMYVSMLGPSTGHQINADVSNFQGVLFFDNNHSYWEAEKFTKRK